MYYLVFEDKREPLSVRGELARVYIVQGYERPPRASRMTRDAAVCLGRMTFGYDTALAARISRDPLDNAEMLQGPNLYAYVGNRPVTYIDDDGQFAWIAAGAVIGAAVNMGMTYAANGGNVTTQQMVAAGVSGAISGALGAAAGPLGGTIAKALGAASNGLGAALASGALSAGAGALGQAAANGIDPCHSSSVANAALWGGVGGGLSKGLIPTNNLNTWAQAQSFGATTLGGLFGSSNAAANAASAAVSSGVGGAANFPASNPF